VLQTEYSEIYHITENLYLLKNELNYNLLTEVALIKDIEEAFIEKDWYTTKLLILLSNMNTEGALYFTGGTCLSKAYKLIERFSEDIDFNLNLTNNTRSNRRKVRDEILSRITVSDDFNFDHNSVISRDNSNFFKVNIQYDCKIDDPTFLRHLHDLSAVNDIIIKEIENFAKIFNDALNEDKTRIKSSEIATLSNKELISKVIKLLEQDLLYKQEYENFVLVMSYAKDQNLILFDKALKDLKEIEDLL